MLNGVSWAASIKCDPFVFPACILPGNGLTKKWFNGCIVTSRYMMLFFMICKAAW